MIVKNANKHTLTLTKVNSPEFETVEMHESIERNGIMRMRQHTQIPIAAHDQLAFTPNGYHLMLMDPITPIKAGMKITLVLKFLDIDEPTTVLATVKRVID